MSITRRTFVGAGLAGAASALAVSGWRAGAAPPEVKEYTLRSDSVPAGLDGMRLLIVSDIHAGANMNELRMRQLVGLLESLKPDLVLLAGDMVDASGSARDVESFAEAFSGLGPSGVVLAVPGNHDHAVGIDRIAAALRGTGIVLLRGDHHVVERGGDRLIVLGLDDPRQRQFDPPQTEAVRALCARAPRDGFRVLLSHRPGAFEEAARNRIPLTVAGHTHGGQIGLLWRDLTPVRLLTEYIRGLYELEGCNLIVSAGVGTGGIPVRVAVPPSVELVTLRSSASRPGV